jgi:hypothetical protein
MGKYIRVPKGITGAGAAIMLLSGLFLCAASAVLVGVNIYFSALGLVEATGGFVQRVDNVWFPAMRVTTGGQMALALGLLLGGVTSVIQGQFWLTDANAEDDTEETAAPPLWSLMIWIVMIYDVGSTWYYLSVGSTVEDSDWLMWLLRRVITLAVTLIGFSIGAEFIGAYGIKMVQTAYHEGMQALADIDFGFKPLGDVGAYLRGKQRAAVRPARRGTNRATIRAVQLQED